MIVRPGQLQLEGYYIRELHCSVRGDLEEATKFSFTGGLHVQPMQVMKAHPYPLNFFVEYGKNEKEPNRYKVTLRVTSEDRDKGAPPYKFDVTIVGFFRLHGVKPAPGIDSTVFNNATMILYSSARELLASATGRGPFPALMLPTLLFSVDKDEPKVSPPKASLKPRARARSRRIAVKK